MKKCRKCGLEKPETEFYSNPRTRDGLTSYCKKCNNDNAKVWQSTHREVVNAKQLERLRDHQAYLDSLKTPCIKCGEKRAYIIQFHHIDPRTKSFNLGECGVRSKETLFQEATKCVCLCSNCHDEFHWFFGKTPDNPKQALEDYLNEDY